MAFLMLKPNDVTLRRLAGCSVLSTCLAVSGASTIDLTGGGSFQSLSSAYAVDFSTSDAGPAALQGAFSSLYRLGTESSGIEEGFNANRHDGVQTMANVDRNPGATTDVTLDELGAMILGDKQYGVFALAVSEPGTTTALPLGTSAPIAGADPARGGKVSLDSFQVFIAKTPLASAATYADLTSHARLAYDFNAASGTDGVTDRSLLLESGDSGHLYVSIPVDLLKAAGATESSYLYVYSKLGMISGYEAEPGFEAWSYLRAGGLAPRLSLGPATHAPEASTWLGGIMVAGLIGGAVWVRRSRG